MQRKRRKSGCPITDIIGYLEVNFGGIQKQRSSVYNDFRDDNYGDILRRLYPATGARQHRTRNARYKETDRGGTEGKRETKAECACDKKTTTRPTPSIIPPRHAFRHGEAQRETHFRADSTLRTSRRDHQRRQRWICL